MLKNSGRGERDEEDQHGGNVFSAPADSVSSKKTSSRFAFFARISKTGSPAASLFRRIFLLFPDARGEICPFFG